MAGILEQIDLAVAAWEARPESWVPGDPLYANPLDACLASDTCNALFAVCEASGCAVGQPCEHECVHQSVRPMLEIIEGPAEYAPVMVLPERRCSPCAVAWSGLGPCWNCGHQPYARPAVVFQPWQQAWLEQVLHGPDLRVSAARAIGRHR